jgi:WD40 repeat protein
MTGPQAGPREEQGPGTEETAVAFAPQARRIAIGGWNGDLWIDSAGSEGREKTQRVFGHEGNVLQLAMSCDGSTLASTSNDRKVRIWKLPESGSPPFTLARESETGGCMALSPDGRYLAYEGEETNVINVWDVANGEFTTIPLREEQRGITALAIGSDYALIFGNYDGGVWKCRADEPGSRPNELVAPKARAVSMNNTYPPNNQVTALALDPGGEKVAVGNYEGLIRVWELRDASKPFISLHGHDGAIVAVSFNEDGNVLASTGGDNTVLLWSCRAPQDRPVVLSKQCSCVGLCFTHPADSLTMVDRKGTISTWITRTEELAEIATHVVRRNLSLDEWRQFIGDDIPYERTCPELPAGEGAPEESPIAR